MIRMEGDLDPRGNVLMLCGTLDEYMRGKHYKLVMEIHDLPIGENNTKVVEVTWTRRSKES